MYSSKIITITAVVNSRKETMNIENREIYFVAGLLTDVMQSRRLKFCEAYWDGKAFQNNRQSENADKLAKSARRTIYLIRNCELS